MPNTTPPNLKYADKAALAEEWKSAFKAAPPRHARAGYLRAALAYHRQGQLGPRLTRHDQRKLERIVTESAQTNERSPKPHRPKSGTRLLREWNGVTYEVTVLEEGYAFDGKVYGNLSTIAEEITGVHWSGPRFFGLKNRKGKRK